MSAATAAVTSSRRLVARVDTRLVGGLLLVALAILGGLRLAGDTSAVTVYVAARDLPAGHRLVRGDLRAESVRATPRVLGALVTHEGAALGEVLRVPVVSGAMLTDSTFTDLPPSRREVTIPLAAERGVGASLRPGDRVDVFASFDAGTAEARTLAVATDVEVTAVVRADAVFSADDGAPTALTVAVPDDDAVFVVFASRNAELDVVRASAGSGAGEQRADYSDVP